jgi:pimeloyl-ACP methyl ester carboxylesterase
MRMFTDHYYDTGTVNLHYFKGPDGGPPLIWLHGVTSSWVSVLPYAPWWQLRHTVYAVEFRGHGLSGRVPGRYRCVDFGEDIHAFIQGHLNEPAILVGHSLGAGAAAYVASHHAEWVRAIVLIDPPFGQILAEARRHFEGVFQQRRDLAAMAKSPAEMRQVLRPQTSFDRRLATTISRLDAGVPNANLDGSVSDGWDTEAILAAIVCPTLLLHGDVDKGGLITPENAEWLRAALKDCVVNHLDMGHGPSPAQCPEVAMIICEFLESLE